MQPLTLKRPKPLVIVSGRTILAHILDALPKEIDEVALVVGYKREMIEEAFGSSYGGRSISYVYQEKPEGTLKALELARSLISGRFLLMNADDIHGKDALLEALLHPLALIVSPHEEPQHFGVVSVREDGHLEEIIEKPEIPPTNLVSTGAMVLDERIVGYAVAPSSSGEYYLPHALNELAKDAPVAVVVQDIWIPIGRPGDIGPAEERLRNIEGKGQA
jgi:NDP-sugar pyrophosphorylase family protein